MTESKPWRPNILPLLCRIEPIFSSKVPGQLNCHLSKYYRKLSFKRYSKSKGELSPDTLYTDCDLMGMDVTGARLWQSLSNAVSRIIAWLATAGGSLSRHRSIQQSSQTLILTVLQPLLKQTADALQMEVKPEQRWCGRRVKAYDGTTVLMSDTIANQQSYPQHSNQKVVAFR